MNEPNQKEINPEPLCKCGQLRSWCEQEAERQHDTALASNAALQQEVERLRTGCRAVKLTCLTETDALRALRHIIRLCIDAGVTEKLDELANK